MSEPLTPDECALTAFKMVADYITDEASGDAEPSAVECRDRLRNLFRAARRQAFKEAAEVDPLEVDCPRCKQGFGFGCHWGPPDFEFSAPHIERWRAALRAKGEES